jgi:hypothetical protein
MSLQLLVSFFKSEREEGIVREVTHLLLGEDWGWGWLLVRQAQQRRKQGREQRRNASWIIDVVESN